MPDREDFLNGNCCAGQPNGEWKSAGIKQMDMMSQAALAGMHGVVLGDDHFNPYCYQFVAVLREQTAIRNNGVDAAYRRDKCKSPSLKLAGIRHHDYFF